MGMPSVLQVLGHKPKHWTNKKFGLMVALDQESENCQWLQVMLKGAWMSELHLMTINSCQSHVWKERKVKEWPKPEDFILWGSWKFPEFDVNPIVVEIARHCCHKNSSPWTWKEDFLILKRWYTTQFLNAAALPKGSNSLSLFMKPSSSFLSAVRPEDLTLCFRLRPDVVDHSGGLMDLNPTPEVDKKPW